MSTFHVPTMAELTAQGQAPEVLFWVGCAGSFDDRAKKITKAIARILHHCDVSFAVLGSEESCTGDPAKRAGNEFLFQMQAAQNIATLNGYEVTKIVTGCPHCFNVLKNEYPELGGHYDVMHHTQFLRELIQEGRLTIADSNPFRGKRITFHDPCYLGRGNGEYAAPREVLQALDAELVEMRRCKQNGLCCGAGGARMWMEEEADQRVSVLRAKEAVATGAETVAVGCPFCLTMMTDGVKSCGSGADVEDVAENLAKRLGL